MKEYMKELGETKSGTDVYTSKSILVTLFREELKDDEVEEIAKCTQTVTREANIKNPAEKHPAEAIALDDLRTLIDRSKDISKTPTEEVALDVLTIAFCTMSRAGERSRIKVEDVLEGEKL